MRPVLDNGGGEALVGAPVTQLAVAVVTPAVEVSALGEGEDVRPGAVGEPDHLLVAERLHLLRCEGAVHVSQSWTTQLVSFSVLIDVGVVHLDVEECSEELLRQHSYAIKNQRGASKKAPLDFVDQ